MKNEISELILGEWELINRERFNLNGNSSEDPLHDATAIPYLCGSGMMLQINPCLSFLYQESGVYCESGKP